MTDAKKFLFDNNDFSKVKSTVEPSYNEEQLLLAKNQGYAQGKDDGVRETRQQQEDALAKILDKAIASLGQLAVSEDAREIEKCMGAASLAMKIVHRLLPKFAETYALPEIESVIIQSLEARRDEPRIAITVPTTHLEALRTRIDELALEKGFAGKTILIADDNMAPTDCRVEWADGGAERLYERLFSQIENEFAKAMTGMAAAIPEEQKQTQEERNTP